LADLTQIDRYKKYLCDTVEIIVDDKLKKLEYDKTIKNATIIDIVDAETIQVAFRGNQYNITVTDSSRFQVNDKIDVHIPQNDLNQMGLLEASGGSLPPGTFFPWPGDTPPDGYIWADGSEVSRITYAGIFAAYGTKYGEGDGSTTFKLPNYYFMAIAK
jgi:hypothetical protein